MLQCTPPQGQEVIVSDCGIVGWETQASDWIVYFARIKDLIDQVKGVAFL